MKALSAELNLAPLSDFDLDGFSAKAAPAEGDAANRNNGKPEPDIYGKFIFHRF